MSTVRSRMKWCRIRVALTISLSGVLVAGIPTNSSAQGTEPPLEARDGQARDGQARDGQARDGIGEGFEVYLADEDRWLAPLDFWLAYAQRRGGLTWGRGATYPPYRDVQEGDTFLVETHLGPCLMEFFHKRWRRANDVKRWNDRFNEHAGCSVVFD